VSYQLFENGSIVSSANGTFPLYGGIRQTYRNTGGLEGWLGAPTSEEKGLGNGNIIQYFDKGYIYWNGGKATAYKEGTGLPSVSAPSNQPISGKGNTIRTGDPGSSGNGSLIGGGIGSYYSQLSPLNDPQWDNYTSDNSQFDFNSSWDRQTDQKVTLPEIREIYTNLSTAIFGKRLAMTTGYARDASYADYYTAHPGKGIKPWHSGIDLGASEAETVKPATAGIIAKVSTFNQYGQKTGYAIAVDETDIYNKPVGRRWWYLHLAGTQN
jgi:hypothetical protein